MAAVSIKHGANMQLVVNGPQERMLTFILIVLLHYSPSVGWPVYMLFDVSKQNEVGLVASWQFE